MYYIHHHYRHLCFVSSVRLFSPLFRLSSLTLTPHPLSPSYPIVYHLLYLHRIPRRFSLRGGLGKFVLVPHLIFNHLRSSDCAHGDTSPGVGYKLVGRRSQLRRRFSVSASPSPSLALPSPVTRVDLDSLLPSQRFGVGRRLLGPSAWSGRRVCDFLWETLHF